MNGFRPVISLLVPGAIGGIIAAIHLLVIRRWHVGAAFGLGAVALAIVACNMQAILVAAWARTTDQNARSNEAALAAIQVDLSPDDLPLLWDESKLSQLENFRWYGMNNFAAPNKTYFGFKIRGIPHVRIQKIRHGWRGVALIPPGTNLLGLQTRSGLAYSRIGSGDWFMWTYPL